MKLTMGQVINHEGQDVRGASLSWRRITRSRSTLVGQMRKSMVAPLQTEALFEKWLLYGLATLFSLAMLSFVSAIVLQVTLRAATALWTTNFINGLLQTSSEGLSMQSLEQGGIGLLMTMLIISVPPMAGNFFQGTLGSFMAYSAFNGAGSRPGPQGQPPGSYGHGGHGASQANANQVATDTRSASGYNSPSTSISPSDPRLGGVGYSAASDTMKQGRGSINPPAAGG